MRDDESITSIDSLVSDGTSKSIFDSDLSGHPSMKAKRKHREVSWHMKAPQNFVIRDSSGDIYEGINDEDNTPILVKEVLMW